MEKKYPDVNYRECMACLVCVQTCPFSCLEPGRTPGKLKKLYPELARREDCTGCGLCARACPVDVIAMV